MFSLFKYAVTLHFNVSAIAYFVLGDLNRFPIATSCVFS